MDNIPWPRGLQREDVPIRFRTGSSPAVSESKPMEPFLFCWRSLVALCFRLPSLYPFVSYPRILSTTRNPFYLSIQGTLDVDPFLLSLTPLNCGCRRRYWYCDFSVNIFDVLGHIREFQDFDAFCLNDPLRNFCLMIAVIDPWDKTDRRNILLKIRTT